MIAVEWQAGQLQSPEAARSSTVRFAEALEEADQEAHKFIRLDDEIVSTLWGSERISVVGEVTYVEVAVPMEKNQLDYSHINPADCYDLVDEDNIGQPLDAQKVVEGVNREMTFLEEQRRASSAEGRDCKVGDMDRKMGSYRIKGDGLSRSEVT
eukprot:1757667-Amphidinium_carterae.1